MLEITYKVIDIFCKVMYTLQEGVIDAQDACVAPGHASPLPREGARRQWCYGLSTINA